MKITLNGPPDQSCDLFARIPVPPDKEQEAAVHESIRHRSPRSSALDEIEAANRGARMHFPSTSSEEPDEAVYKSYELKSPPLAPVIRPAAKATLSMSFLF